MDEEISNKKKVYVFILEGVSDKYTLEKKYFKRYIPIDGYIQS